MRKVLISLAFVGLVVMLFLSAIPVLADPPVPHAPFFIMKTAGSTNNATAGSQFTGPPHVINITLPDESQITEHPHGPAIHLYPGN